MSTSQRTPSIVRSHQKLEEARKEPGLADTLSSGLSPPELWENKPLSFPATQPGVSGYGNPGKLIHRTFSRAVPAKLSLCTLEVPGRRLSLGETNSWVRPQRTLDWSVSVNPGCGWFQKAKAAKVNPSWLLCKLSQCVY